MVFKIMQPSVALYKLEDILLSHKVLGSLIQEGNLWILLKALFIIHESHFYLFELELFFIFQGNLG